MHSYTSCCFEKTGHRWWNAPKISVLTWEKDEQWIMRQCFLYIDYVLGTRWIHDVLICSTRVQRWTVQNRSDLWSVLIVTLTKSTKPDWLWWRDSSDLESAWLVQHWIERISTLDNRKDLHIRALCPANTDVRSCSLTVSLIAGLTWHEIRILERQHPLKTFLK
jgi:hypothetical protein